MTKTELRFIKSFIDVRGKRRYVFRRRGSPRQISIKGRPGSIEFMTHYAELLAQSENRAARVGASFSKLGSIDALIIKYVKHKTFTCLAKTTQATRRRILDRFRDFKTPSGKRYGDARFSTMIEDDIYPVLKGKPPTVQGDWMKAIRHLIAFAIEQSKKDAKEFGVFAIKKDPTIGITTDKPDKSDGHLPWGDAQIEQYCERHPYGTMARLAIELMLNMAARRNDTFQIGRQHMSFDPERQRRKLTWRPSKTSKTTNKLLSIRVLPELQAALDAMPPTDALTFLLTEYGRPFKSPAAFGNRFADWCKQAGLEPVLCDDGKVRSYRCHGLRKAACVRMAHHGCTAIEIMSVSGHKTLAEAEKYIKAVEQERMADAAMDKVAAGSKHARQVSNAKKDHV